VAEKDDRFDVRGLSKEYEALFQKYDNEMPVGEVYRQKGPVKFLLIMDSNTMILKPADGKPVMYHRKFSEEHIKLLPKYALDMIWPGGRTSDFEDGSLNILVQERKDGGYSYRKGRIGEVRGLKEAMKVINPRNQGLYTRMRSTSADYLSA